MSKALEWPAVLVMLAVPVLMMALFVLLDLLATAIRKRRDSEEWHASHSGLRDGEDFDQEGTRDEDTHSTP